MKRHPALHALSHDHHQGLILAQQLKKNAPEYKGLPKTFEGKLDYLFNFYETELVNHFSEEEEILYPAVKGKNEEVDNLFQEIFSEHSQIHALVKKMKDKPDEDSMDKLGKLLESHIRKEERELFQLVQDALNNDEMSLLNKELARDKK
jgi:iron-sulfur cluster repair protein YtfE (RIC family)